MNTTVLPNMLDRDPATMPLEEIDISYIDLWKNDAKWPFFKRLRDEAPVHYCRNSEYGAFWSITRFEDIMEVEKNWEIFSSYPRISIGDPVEGSTFSTPTFIAMDPPNHDDQRKTVQGAVAPQNLKELEATIRSRAAQILDDLPLGETFNWVDRVSIELTTQMLATLFDFPFEDRSKLTRWSDIVFARLGEGIIESHEQRQEELMECLAYFTRLWKEREDNPVGNDFISMMIRGDATRDLSPQEYLGNILLLIVGGNDTTRNSISGGVLALNQNPQEYQKLRDNPAVIPNMVSEIIRWVTPLAHMRRTVTNDYEFRGQQMKAGDKVIMWYASGNRDERSIKDPEKFLVDRERARNHISFGFGLHRCMGNRMAEMQLRVLWEEIQQRFERIEVMGPEVRTPSCFVHGYTDLPVRLHAKA
ncbi:MAG: cytochrome P450 [Gammaproteobacteria bacterium]|jgi:cytochrome P450|nr:cytochrome P450 [Gammaproteobacteria bacterium]